MTNNYQYYSVITKTDDTFDCLVDGRTFLTEKDCLDAIARNKVEDKAYGWDGDYNYSEPREIFIS